MSFALPNGSRLYIASGYETAKNVSAVTNASPGVATSTAHGYTEGDVIEATLGWSDMQGRVLKVGTADTNTFGLAGIDTTDTDDYPTAGGVGTVKKVSGWTEITQILNSSSEGGEPTYATGKPLDTGREFRLPTGNSAEGLNLELGDDDTLPWFSALTVASKRRTPYAFRLRLSSGAEIYYNMIVHFNATPTLTVDNVMVVRASLSFQAPLTRYSAA